MSIVAQRLAIETSLMDSMSSELPLVEIAGENVNFQPGAGCDWMRISLEAPTIEFRYIGLNQQTTRGLFTAQIFAPKSAGSKRANFIADSVIRFLKENVIAGIEFIDFSITPSSLDDGWYMNVVRANYTAQN
jgi:hypothetical protein